MRFCYSTIRRFWESPSPTSRTVLKPPLLLFILGSLFAFSCGGGSSSNLSRVNRTAALSAAPPTIDFGDVLVGGSSDLITILKNGGADTVTISKVAVSGTGFTVDAPSVPFTLKAGQTANLSTKFSPQSDGSMNGSLSVTGLTSQATSGGSDTEVATVTLQGSGVSQTLAASPASVSFGEVAVGSNSTQQVELSLSLPSTAGTSSTPIDVSSATISGKGFSFASSFLPATLTGNQVVTYSIRFTPPAAGSFSGSISFISDASNSPMVVELSGTGVIPTQTVGLAWDPPAPESGVTVEGYNIFRGDAVSSSCSGVNFSQVGSTSGVNSTSFSDKTVLGDHTYCYEVTSVSNSGESSPSNVVQAVVPSS